MKKNVAGVSMLELIISVAIIGIFFASAAMVFNVVGKSIMISRTRTVANNIAQEKIESLKNVSYHRLRVTSTSDYTSPGYDKTYYPPELGILVGDVPYERRVLICRVRENASGGLEDVLPDAGDTSLKRITVTVVWTERSETKSLSISNLREDPNRRPMDGMISGTVTGSATPLSGAVVSVFDNINWNDSTDAAGYYEIKVPTGTYKVKASRTGFFPHVSNDLTVPQPVTYDINLQQMAFGSATGYIFINDHLVISKVVGSTVTALGQDLEWVEIYNPTTYYWTMNSTKFRVEYVKPDDTIDDLDIDFCTNTLPPYSYFLISNTGTVVLGGYTVLADAKYNTEDWDTIKNDNGGIRIKYNGSIVDCLGWAKTATLVPTNADLEPEGIKDGNGINAGCAHIRTSAPNLFDPYLGNAYDSNCNKRDFAPNRLISTFLPYNTSISMSPISGTPKQNAIIACNDGVSSPVSSFMVNIPLVAPIQANPVGAYFNLTNIATGTWNVSMYFSSNSYRCSLEISTVAVLTPGTTVGIPNNITSPTWPYPNKNYSILNSTLTTGFISGLVRNQAGIGIPNIKVEATKSNLTSATGRYLLALEEGLYNITANPSLLNPSYNPNYTSLSLGPLAVAAGNVYTLNFDLSTGGTLGGRVRTEAGDNLPDVVVIAKDINGNEVGSGISDSSGLFFVPNLASSSTPHILRPILDSGESSNPVSSNHWVTMGQTMWPLVSTFTISSAYGNFIGSVTYNNELIKTGVLILATTMTMGATPPEFIDYGTRTSSPTIYGTVSHSDGTYVLPVRGPATYNIYAWYTIMSGGIPQTKNAAASNQSITAGGKKRINFTTW